MTVRELLLKLSDMPLDAKVVTEGCDCFGDAEDVVLVEQSMKDHKNAYPPDIGDVLITRN